MPGARMTLVATSTPAACVAVGAGAHRLGACGTGWARVHYRGESIHCTPPPPRAQHCQWHECFRAGWERVVLRDAVCVGKHALRACKQGSKRAGLTAKGVSHKRETMHVGEQLQKGHPMCMYLYMVYVLPCRWF